MTSYFSYSKFVRSSVLLLLGLLLASVDARNGGHRELARGANVTSHIEILVRRFTTVTSCDNCGDNSCPICCIKGYYRGENYPIKCVANETLCDNEQPYMTGENCKTCLGCGGNRCDEEQFQCPNKEDLGDCCIPNDGKGTMFYWFCKGCAPCPPGYYATTYRSTKYNCVACKTISNPNQGINCFGPES